MFEKLFKALFKKEVPYRNIGGMPLISRCEETQEDLLIRLLIQEASLKNYYK